MCVSKEIGSQTIVTSQYARHVSSDETGTQQSLDRFESAAENRRTGFDLVAARPSFEAQAGNPVSWQSTKTTWKSDFWPWREQVPGGDPAKNLYAQTGSYHKYDQAFGTNSQEWEFQNRRIPFGAQRNLNDWAENCDRVCKLVSALEKPRRPVEKNGVTFSPRDIEGLLVGTIDAMVTMRMDLCSQNGPIPAEQFLKFLLARKNSVEGNCPFMLDIDQSGTQVHLIPFDRIEILEFPKSPGNALIVVELSGTGYEHNRQKYKIGVQRNQSGEIVAADWIEDREEQKFPDLVCSAILNNPGSQIQRQNPDSNPFISPNYILEMYRESL